MLQSLFIFSILIIVSHSLRSASLNRITCSGYVEQFSCPQYSFREVDFIQDPYLCDVHHMCYQGIEVSRICCSDDQIFSLQHQACITRPEDSVDECRSTQCVSEYYNDICFVQSKFIPQPYAATEECAAVLQENMYHSVQKNIYHSGSTRAGQTCLVSGQSFCSSCGESVFCMTVGGILTPYPDPCDTSSACVGGTCSATVPTNCTCGTGTTGTVYKPDPYSNQWYIMCIGTDIYYMNCGDGFFYDGGNGCSNTTYVTTTTTAPTTAAPVPCDSVGAFPTSCSDYEVCTAVGANPIPRTCSGTTTYFNPTTESCSEYTEFQCSVSGAYGDPYDCRRYYICNGNKVVAEKCCNATQIWDSSIASCIAGACLTNYSCKPQPSTSTPATNVTTLPTPTTNITAPPTAVTNTTSTSTPVTNTTSTSTPAANTTSTSTPATNTTSTSTPSTTTTSTVSTTTVPTTTLPPNVTVKCDGSNNGEYFCDPNNAKAYYVCSNGTLQHGYCPGTLYFNCSYLYCE